jgi:hypothetical protein
MIQISSLGLNTEYTMLAPSLVRDARNTPALR